MARANTFGCYFMGVLFIAFAAWDHHIYPQTRIDLTGTAPSRVTFADRSSPYAAPALRRSGNGASSMNWLWILGFFLAIWIIFHVIVELVQSWQLRSLSSTQRRLVRLMLAQRQLSLRMADWGGRTISEMENSSIRKMQNTEYSRLGEEINRLHATLDEAQYGEVLGALARLWTPSGS